MRGTLSKKILLLIASVLVLAGSCIGTSTVYADDDEKTPAEYIEEYYTNNYPDKLNQGVAKYASVTANTPASGTTSVKFEVDGSVYYVNYKASSESDFVKAIKAANNNEAAIEEINKITDNMGIKADVDGASKYTTGVVPVVNQLLGFMVIIITLLMFLLTSVDILFIELPPFQESVVKNAENGGIMYSNSAKKGMGIRFITREAQYAVKTCTVESGKNPLIVYGGKRLMGHLVLTALIITLLSGNLNVFTNIAARLIGGVINVISGL